DAVSSMLYLNFGRQDSESLTNEQGGHENLEAIRFLRDFNVAVHREVPGAITIAEEASSWPGVSLPVDAGGLGFTLKWNMGWMNDTLAYFRAHPADRHLLHEGITFSLMYAFSENYVLPFSHDEVVHLKGSMLGKMAGDWWQQFATLRALYLYLLAHPGKKLAFMGLELGEWQEWSETRALDWNLLQWPHHRGLHELVRRANHLYRSLPALWQGDFRAEGFRWIDVHNARHSTLAWSRQGNDYAEPVLALCNFSHEPLRNYRLGVAEPGYYEVLLNSDDEQFGGSGTGARGHPAAEPRPRFGQPFSLLLDLPALSALWLQRTPNE
ncbi:MAG: alpha amylase C-terminal domain-containing protein, partial [Anaerolineaceae bacterium]|nr:alpha amylase C-terminal domain-containing protein [Anaerolineaceae bacterium]